MSCPAGDTSHHNQPDLLLESIDRHFMAGCGFIDAAQLRSHKAFGMCLECSARAQLAARRQIDAAVAGRDTAGGDQ